MTVNKILAMYMYDIYHTPSRSYNDDDDMMTSGNDNDVDNDKDQSSQWYSQIKFTCIQEEIKD